MKNLVLILVLIGLSACNFNTNEATPTVDGIIEEPINPLPQVTDITPSPTASPTLTPTPTDQAIAQIITQVPTATPPPTATPQPTETPGPWEYVIKEGETLGYIIQQPPHNYPYDPAVIDAVVRLNDNIASADILPPVGSTILIPRPTVEPLETVFNNNSGNTQSSSTRTTRPRVGLPAGVQIGQHTIREGETVVAIVQQYGGLTLEIFSQLNPDISFLGCNFSEPSGGPNCSPLISQGQQVNVPLPTPTITLTPTPSGNETATPTPTFRAPNMVSPPAGAVVSGPITLYWDSVGILNPEEYYLVQVIDRTTNTTYPDITKNTFYRLPDSLIPADGEPHEMEWNVTVARANAEGAFAPVGNPGETHTFIWQSR